MRDFLFKLIGKQRENPPCDTAADGIAADAPIRGAAQDRLRRAAFAARIAEILAGPSIEEGRVFAIRGAWGNGKSSLKNMVAEQLQARGDIMWLDFNPWQWGDGDTIARALFRQMADKLGGKLSASAGRRAKLLRQYGSILTAAGKPLENVGSRSQTITSVLTSASVLVLAGAMGLTLPSATTIAALLAIASFGVPLIGKVMTALGHDYWSAPLDDIRRSLEKSLRRLERPLVVFVDDIDRLEPADIRLIFRQVKVNANLPNIVFVLLFQPSIVESALDPIADGEGRAFLEKIVQANFDLPYVPLSMVHTAMTQELSGVAGAHASAENGFEQVRWGNVLVGTVQAFVRNLRDARRYLSSVAVHLPLHVGHSAFEVNIIDFLALEALRVFEPGVHAALAGERDLLLQAGRFPQDGRDEEFRARAKSFIERAAEGRREILQATLAELFPRLRWSFGGSYYSSGEWDTKWIQEKRVCTSRFFPRYFELQTPEGELSESDFGDLIALSGDCGRLNETIERIRGRGLIKSLAARLDESVDRLPVENAAALLPAMFRLAQSLVGFHAADPFNSPWVSAWRSISWYVRRLPAADRGSLLLSALKQTGALSVGAILIHLNSPEDQNENHRIKPDIDDVAVKNLRQEWLEQVRSLAAQKLLLDQPDLCSLLFRWRDYSGGLDEPRSWVADVTETDVGFANLVAKLMTIGTTQSIEDRVASRFETFERAIVEAFFVVKEARGRIGAIERSRLSSEATHALDVLARHLEEWSRNQNEPLADDLVSSSSDATPPRRQPVNEQAAP